MSSLDAALSQVGVNLSASVSLGAAIDQFSEQNLSPADISDAGKLVRALATQLPLPPVGVTAAPVPASGGSWTSVHYADDLVGHQPKFKFLFKVKFEGFDTHDHQYFVHRCDKPRINFQHTDVNYYNFRTKVLTSTVLAPLSITFLDEIGNSVNDFFVQYLAKISGQASGGWGIDQGFGAASSTKPYPKGYSKGKKIIVEQVFANGQLSNRFNFINPRIESLEFDELSMEDNAGSLLTMSFSYDALTCETVGMSTLYSWGETDLLKGGGSSGAPNAGGTSVNEGGILVPQSVSGQGLGIGDLSVRVPQRGTSTLDLAQSLSSPDNYPGSLRDLADPFAVVTSVATDVISSAGDVLNQNISETLSSIQSGANLQFNDLTAGISTSIGVNLSGGDGGPPPSPSNGNPWIIG